LWGLREDKYRRLFEANVETTQWTELDPKGENYFFIRHSAARSEEYLSFFSLNEIVEQYISGADKER